MTPHQYQMQNELFSFALIQSFLAAGVHSFVICPGARNAPLIAAIHALAAEQTEVVLDERNAGFFALGQIKASQKPCVVVTTSGTAVANLGPALVEAHQEGLPLVVLSANRPASALGTDENQTVPQRGLFTPLLSFSAALEAPCEKILTSERLVAKAASSVHNWQRALKKKKGPAHFDVAFEKRLEPMSPQGAKRILQENSTLFSFIISESKNCFSPIDISSVLLFQKSMDNAQKGVILLGRMAANERAQVLSWAEKSHWPILCDVLFGACKSAIQNQNALFESKLLDDVDVVLHLGGSFVSKDMKLWKQRLSKTLYLRIDDAQRVGSVDYEEQIIHHTPKAATSLRLPALEAKWCKRVLGIAEKLEYGSHDKFKICFQHAKCENQMLSEPVWLQHLNAYLPKDLPFFLGNSSPMRWFDEAILRQDLPLHIFGNRGASGIDGLLASAVGMAKTLGASWALLGDLSTLHDVGSLLLLVQQKSPLLVVVFNNKGGGLFHRLPISAHSSLFTRFFKTPHSLYLRPIAASFGILSHSISQPEVLKICLQNWLKSPQPMLIEILTDSETSNLQRINKKKLNSKTSDSEFRVRELSL